SVPNPLHAMARLIASLHEPDGRVAVQGFYAQVRELDASERAEIAALPFDERAYLAQVGATAAFGEPGYSTLERQWTRPTLEINGMWGGYEGPGSKTVVPSQAHAKITCRLVPDQEPDDIIKLVMRHLEQHVPPGARLTIEPGTHGARPASIGRNHPVLKAAEAALEETFGERPVVVRMGGTLPVAGLFKRILGLATVYSSFSPGDEDSRARAEFFRVERLHRALAAGARLWER